MYCVQLTLKPTAAMTFRILPGSILNIATYPFVPPTTLSGYLRRIGMLSVGLELPETCINKEKPPIYALPQRYVSLGAYPTQSSWRGVHRTYRKGMREFSHDAFSRIYQEKDRANFQLHTWEYLLAEELVGYVVSESSEALEQFEDFESYGCKIGKEGFAFITEVSNILELKRETLSAFPSTIVPMEALLENNQFIGGCDIYNLYRYNWLSNAPEKSEQEGFLDAEPTAIDGFIPFVAAYFSHESSEVPVIDYYTDGDIQIPVSLVNLMRGIIHA